MTRILVSQRILVSKKVKENLADICGLWPSQILDTSLLTDDCGLDSLDILELSMMFEKTFNITIDDQALDFNGSETVGEVIDFLTEKIKKQNKRR